MTKRLAPTLVSAVYEATLRSFWRRKALWRFLRQAGISERFLATWDAEESKREFLDRLFARLSSEDKGQDVFITMARDLTQQESFPDLKGWEDSDKKLKEARQAVGILSAALARLEDQVQSERERQQAQARFRTFQEELRRSRESLDTLEQRLAGLANRLGSQEAGYDFEKWFYDLLDFFEIVNRRSYEAQGRQIDGSMTVSGTTYLAELKFTARQAEPSDIDTLLAKVVSKADNTMGVMVSVAGYTSTALQQASGPRTPLLLLDHGHLYLALRGLVAFNEIVERVRRHASQTGEAYLAASNFET
jgi:hypothetical protein